MNRIAFALLGVALLGGCAQVPKEAGFGDVKQIAAEHGVERIHWNQGTDADHDAEQAVRQLLKQELTADTAVQIALLNNRNLQATYEDLGVAQADVVQVGLLKNPVFSGDIRFAEGGGGTGVELAVSQNFIDLFYIPLRKRVAEAEFEAAKRRVVGEVLGLAARTRLAFLDVQTTQQNEELRRSVADATAASYDLAKRLHAAGNIKDLNLANERALHEQANLDLATAQIETVQARERLNTLIGIWGVDTQWKVTSRLPDPSADDSKNDVEKIAVDKSLDLDAARSRIIASASRLGLERKAGLIPEAEIGVNAQREPAGEWSIGPGFSIPIPLFDQGQAAVARAQAELRRSRAEYIALAVEVRSQARTASARVSAARSRVTYYHDVILPLRREVTERTQLQYNAMQVSAFQLIQAKQAEIESGVEYIESLRDYWRSRAQLDQLVAGKLTDEESPSPAKPAARDRNRSTGGH